MSENPPSVPETQPGDEIAEPQDEYGRPIFVDNRDDNTLERAIKAHLTSLQERGEIPWELCISSGFFTLEGFTLLADELERMGGVRLLLGAQPEPEFAWPERKPGDPKPDRWAREYVRRTLEQQEVGLARQRDLLPFNKVTFAAIERLVRFLGKDGVEVRRYEDQFLHAKAFDFRLRDGGLISGSSNLTGPGLKRSLELNLGCYDGALVNRVELWYDELWNQAQAFDLAALYQQLLQAFPPFLVFLRVLLELYGSELEEEASDEAAVALTEFQRHGVWRALKLLDQYHGVLVADGVGLGKTYTAGEIIRRYVERRQRVLLVCPAQLRDTTWKAFLSEHQLFAESVSYEELAMDEQLGGEHRKLERSLDEYALVVVDEAHNYRNPSAVKRAGVLRQLLSGQRRDLVLLTATPVNNSLWDLYHLLSLFLRQDSALADKSVRSLRELFKQAMKEDPYDLHPDQLFPVIDATTVKRTRKFIRSHYEGDRIPGPDGRSMPIQFPKPVAGKLEYDLEQALPGVFDRIEAALMPKKGEPRLKLARYMPDEYLPERARTSHAGLGLVGLVRSGLLKRFESSAYAFHQTMKRMVEEHKTFLNTLERGYIAHKQALREIGGADDDEAIDEILTGSEQVKRIADHDVETLRRDVEADVEVLTELRDAVTESLSDPGPKIARLVHQLKRIAATAEAEASDERDARDRRKVLIFSFYEETADWIYQHLERAIEQQPELALYRGRIAAVGGQEGKHGVSRDKAVRSFAPETAGDPGRDEDLFDILVTTDVLAEGVNLQQCRHIINYDLPWNPMRLVQRHGRVDRINSNHRKVFLDTFFPDRQLDRLLALEERVLAKLAQAAASVGVETPPIPGAEAGAQSFSETRDEILRLADEDATIYEEGGTESAAQTGEEYRQQLRKALADPQRRRDLESLPWKAGSGMVKGDRRGHVFCAKVGERTYLRFVPMDPEEKIEVKLGTCLRMLECTEDTECVLADDLREGAFSAWERAQKDIHDAWMYETDPGNLQPTAPKIHREISALLQDGSLAGIEQKRIEHAVDALAAPSSHQVQKQLREVFELGGDRREKAKLLIDKVEELGLEPSDPPQPLPPIELDEVRLVCWMGVEAPDA